MYIIYIIYIIYLYLLFNVQKFFFNGLPHVCYDLIVICYLLFVICYDCARVGLPRRSEHACVTTLLLVVSC